MTQTIQFNSAPKGRRNAIQGQSVNKKPYVILYLFDGVTKYRWIAHIERDKFIEFCNEPVRLCDREGVENFVATEFSQWADTVNLSPSNPAQMAMRLCLYAGYTDTVKAIGAEDIGHFCAILYRPCRGISGVLSPAAVRYTDGQPMEIKEFVDFAESMAKRDRILHPHWPWATVKARQ